MYQLLACWPRSSRRRRAETGPCGALRIVRERTVAAAAGQPGERPAPVVADDVGALVPERADEAGDVAHQRARRVGFDRRRPVGAAVAAQVGGDRVEAGLGEGGELVAPGVRQLREAVEDHRLAGRVARLHDRQAHLARRSGAGRAQSASASFSAVSRLEASRAATLYASASVG